MNKQTYDAPVSELLELVAERTILSETQIVGGEGSDDGNY